MEIIKFSENEFDPHGVEKVMGLLWKKKKETKKKRD
jgi:hypothetical protein